MPNLYMVDSPIYYTAKMKHLNSFHCQVYGLESLGFSFQVMMNNELFGFRNIQHVKLTASQGTYTVYGKP